ncbi:MAG: CrcB family protein [Rhodobacteraceae bacterium]|nr:CrcB family protein [Paracoccaceae bacterium]
MELTLTSVLAVFLGGALGGVARAWISAKVVGPVGILLVNVSGSFALGLLAGFATQSSLLWLVLATGVLGAFTTVSSFALLSVQMWGAGRKKRASGYVVMSVLSSVCAVGLGFWVAAP